MCSSWGLIKVQFIDLRGSEIPCSLVRIRSAVQIDWDICCPMSVWTLQPGLCISYMYTFQDQTVVWSVQCQHNAVYYSLWSIWPVHQSESQCITVHFSALAHVECLTSASQCITVYFSALAHVEQCITVFQCIGARGVSKQCIAISSVFQCIGARGVSEQTGTEEQLLRPASPPDKCHCLRSSSSLSSHVNNLVYLGRSTST